MGFIFSFSNHRIVKAHIYLYIVHLLVIQFWEREPFFSPCWIRYVQAQMIDTLGKSPLGNSPKLKGRRYRRDDWVLPPRQVFICLSGGGNKGLAFCPLCSWLVYTCGQIVGGELFGYHRQRPVCLWEDIWTTYPPPTDQHFPRESE